MGRTGSAPLSPPALELVQPRRDEQTALLPEEQAVRRDDAGAVELDRADLVAVGDRRRRCTARRKKSRGGPLWSTAAVRTVGRHQRDFAFARLPLRPRRRQAGDDRIDLQTRDTAFEDQRAVAVVFAERPARRPETRRRSRRDGSTSGIPLLSARCTSGSSSWPVRRERSDRAGSRRPAAYPAIERRRFQAATAGSTSPCTAAIRCRSARCCRARTRSSAAPAQQRSRRREIRRGVKI